MVVPMIFPMIGFNYKSFQVGASKQLKHLKEGLELYMQHFLLRRVKDMGEDAKSKLKFMVQVAVNALNLNKDTPYLVS